jgi:rare lipoprotein A
MRTCALLLAALTVGVSTICGAEEAFRQEGEEASRQEGDEIVRQEGIASFYADKFQGRKTASGDRFKQSDLSAASRDLPLGAKATVRNLETGDSVEVEITDRGPFVPGRVIDLTKRAAREIGITNDKGIAPVAVEVKPENQPTPELKEKVEEKAKTKASP